MFDPDLMRIFITILICLGLTRLYLWIFQEKPRVIPPERTKLISIGKCTWTSETQFCTARGLEDCVSNLCFEDCDKVCKCGAGREALELIKIYGTLAEADRAIRRGELVETRRELPEWRREDKADE